MKSITCKEEPKKLEEIRTELLAGREVKVYNEYEKVYGVGFDRWLRKGIEDIPCDIEVTSWNKWYSYPWTYIITPKM